MDMSLCSGVCGGEVKWEMPDNQVYQLNLLCV